MSQNKSFISKLAESILKSTKPKYMDSNEELDKFLVKKSQEINKPVKSIFKSVNLCGMQVFTFGDKEKSDKTIIYMHGGAYVGEINYQHQLFCWYLARKLNAYILAPVYPLAPNHNALETFELIENLYKSLIDYNNIDNIDNIDNTDTTSNDNNTDDVNNKRNSNNIIFMGDSAGGGFVLSFSQYLKSINLPQPKEIITFSPWIDISMSNGPFDSENDPILGEIGLKGVGKSWAGDLDTRDYKVSPLFGDNKGLTKSLIFVGDEEIFYEDIKNFHKNLINEGIDSKLVVGKGMFHIYPLFPIPEAKEVIKEIINELNK